MQQLQPLLNEYLIENGHLPVEGAGLLSIESKSAVLHEENSTIAPPLFSIDFSEATFAEEKTQLLIDFIADRLNTSKAQATQLLAKEVEMQKILVENETADWHPFGHFKKAETGNTIFQQQDAISNYLPAILVHPLQLPILLLEEEDTIAVEKTPDSEPAYVFSEPAKKDNWWIWAIVIFVFSVLLILFRFIK